MSKLGKTIEEQNYTRQPRIEYGTVRQVTKAAVKMYKWKDGQIKYAHDKNLVNESAMLMLHIAEVDDTKDFDELGTKTLWVNTEVGDMLRAGTVKLEACYDLIVAEHTNKNSDGTIKLNRDGTEQKPYPLCVRPSADNSANAKKLHENGAVLSKSTSTFSWDTVADPIDVDSYITVGVDE